MQKQYEKVYFNDDYSKQFAALRSQYYNRTQDALEGRVVDHAPVSNIASVVLLHDEGDGGTTITEMDFATYFNQRYGNSDRLGAMRASIAHAVRKADKSGEQAKRLRREKARREGAGILSHIRSAKRHLVFVHALFALMLMLSFVMLLGSSVLLDRTEQKRASLSAEATALEVTDEGPATEEVSYLSLQGEEEAEVYAPAEEEVSMSVLLNAFAKIFTGGN